MVPQTSTTDRGHSSLSPIGLGTSRLASFGSGISQPTAVRLIVSALDHGILTIDTADTYGSGDSERVIGSALNSRRKDCFLITKAGFPYVSLPAALSPINQIGKKVLQRVSPRKEFSKSYLLRGLEKSLRRLKTDHVDAFLLHEPLDGELSSDTWEALDEIRGTGKSRMTGVSTADVSVLREGIRFGQVQIVQTPISTQALKRREILNLCCASKIDVVANQVLSPLSLLERSQEWSALRSKYEADVASTANLLIAFAAAQPAVRTVLVGTKSISHLIANLEALTWVDRMRPLFTEMERALA
jgi:pyridoxine 4-dehydrogenase